MRVPLFDITVIVLLSLLGAAPAQAQGTLPQPSEAPRPASAPASGAAPAGPAANPAPAGAANLRTTAEEQPSETDDFAGMLKERVDKTQNVATALKKSCADQKDTPTLKKSAERILLHEFLQRKLAELSPAERGKKPQTEIENALRGSGLTLNDVPAAHKGAASAELTKFSVPAVDGAGDALSTTRQMCSEYCNDASSTEFDFCALNNAVPATASVAVDWETLQTALKSIEDSSRKSLRTTGYDWEAIGQSKSEPAIATLLHEAKADAREAGLLPSSFSAFSTKALEVGLSALARLIVDRAKREGIAWFLQRVGDDLCGKDNVSSDLQRELKEYWFPSLCALAAKDHMMQYGAGAELLSALQSAVRADLKSWPGALAGLVMSEVLLKSWGVKPANEPRSLACHSNSPTLEICDAASSVRAATSTFVSALIAGSNATVELSTLANRLYAITEAQRPGALNSSPMPWAMCAATLPLTFEEYDEPFKTILGAPARRAQAVALTAVVGNAPCAKILGPGKGGVHAVLRLQQKTRGVVEIANRAELLSNALKTYRESAKKASQSLAEAGSVEPPKAAELKSTQQARTAATVLRATVAIRVQSATMVHLHAALGVADATVGLSQAVLDFLFQLNVAPVAKVASAARELLDDAASAINIVRSASENDFGTLSAEVLATLSRHPVLRDQSEGLRTIFGKHAGTVVALANAEDPDQLAEALDNAAAPVGGWRAKGTNRLTVSLASHAGFFSGAEQRWGQYGANYEGGGDLYFVAPAPVLPLGVDIAWGENCRIANPFGIFVSLIDPFAFLQYDTSEDNKLPSPNLVTAIAPGAGIRWGFDSTPISLLLPMVTYRPGLRSWEGDLFDLGANVLQYGGAIAIDVTLWELYSDAK